MLRIGSLEPLMAKGRCLWWYQTKPGWAGCFKTVFKLGNPFGFGTDTALVWVVLQSSSAVPSL